MKSHYTMKVKEMGMCLAWGRDSSGDLRAVFSYLKSCSVEEGMELFCVLLRPGGWRKVTGIQILIVKSKWAASGGRELPALEALDHGLDECLVQGKH